MSGDLTSGRIARCIADLDRMPATAHGSEAAAVLRALAAADGAIAIADLAAWELVASECGTFRDEWQGLWWDTDLGHLVDEDSEMRRQVSAALRYLHARGITQAHQQRPHLVRLTDSIAQAWGWEPRPVEEVTP